MPLLALLFGDEVGRSLAVLEAALHLTRRRQLLVPMRFAAWLWRGAAVPSARRRLRRAPS